MLNFLVGAASGFCIGVAVATLVQAWRFSQMLDRLLKESKL